MITLLKSFGTLIAGMSFAAIAHVLQITLLARELGAPGVGIIASVIATTSIASALISFRTTEAVIRWLSDESIKQSPQMLSALISSASLAEIIPRGLAMGLVMLLAPLLSLWFTDTMAHSRLFAMHSVIVFFYLPNQYG